MTQKQIIKNKLQSESEVSNYWAIDNRVTTRLAAVIDVLRKEGMDIETTFKGKECIYKLRVKETLFS